MQKANQGKLQPFDASKYRVGIVVADFNADVTEKLLASALAKAKEFKIPAKNISVYHVAGSVEIPVVLKALAETKNYDALVSLAAIIRGDTDHYDYVCKIISEGVLAVMLQTGVPVGFGVLTCDNLQQTENRHHVGAGALAAALQSAKIISTFVHGREQKNRA